MPSRLLSLPAELREYIWGCVLYTQGPAQLIEREDAVEIDHGTIDDSGEEMNGVELRRRHKLRRALDLSLLRVCRQVKQEAEHAFYHGVFFMVDCDIPAAIRFFKTLPRPSMQDIEAIAITGQALYGSPPVASFAASLTAELPGLTSVTIYMHYDDVSEPFHSDPTLIDLFKLFRHGQIDALDLAFFGEGPPQDLKDEASREQSMKKMLSEWRKRPMLNAGAYGIEMKGRWVNRDIDMGSDGQKQAVCALWHVE